MTISEGISTLVPARGRHGASGCAAADGTWKGAGGGKSAVQQDDDGPQAKLNMTDQKDQGSSRGDGKPAAPTEGPFMPIPSYATSAVGCVGEISRVLQRLCSPSATQRSTALPWRLTCSVLDLRSRRAPTPLFPRDTLDRHPDWRPREPHRLVNIISPIFLPAAGLNATARAVLLHVQVLPGRAGSAGPCCWYPQFDDTDDIGDLPKTMSKIPPHTEMDATRP